MASRFLYLYFFFLYLPFFSFSNSSLDSLHYLLEKATDTQKIKVYNSLSNFLLKLNELDSAIAYAEIAGAMSEEVSFSPGKILSFINLGDIYSARLDYDMAILNFQRALELSTRYDDKESSAAVYGKMANLYHIQGKYEEALKNYYELLKMAENMNNKKMLASANGNIGEVNRLLGKFDEAISFFERCGQIYESLGDKKNMANILNNMGLISAQQNHFPEALKYHDEALKIRQEVYDSNGIAGSYNNLAMTYDYMAEAASNQAQRNQLLNSALENYYKSLTVCEAISDQVNIAICCINMGILYAGLENHSNASLFLNRSLNIGKRIGYTDVVKTAYKALSELDKKTGNWKGAFINHQIFSALSDSLFNVESQKNINEMQTKYETEKKEKENRLLLKDNEIKGLEIAAQKNQKYLLFAAICLMLITSLIFYKHYKSKSEKKRSEELLKREKLRIQSMVLTQENERKRIAGELHDGIGQMLSAVKMNISALETAKDDFEKQHTTTLKLIDESYLELGNISHNIMPVLLVKKGIIPAVKELTDALNKDSRLRFYFDTPEAQIRLDNKLEIHLYRIIQELLNNIIKYAEASEVRLEFNFNEELFNVKIQDNGKGFDKSILKTSNGNGWNNIQSRIEIMNARIEVESETGKGTVVFIKVPVKNQVSAEANA